MLEVIVFCCSLHFPEHGSGDYRWNNRNVGVAVEIDRTWEIGLIRNSERQTGIVASWKQGWWGITAVTNYIEEPVRAAPVLIWDAGTLIVRGNHRLINLSWRF